jgi:hypothetical protein
MDIKLGTISPGGIARILDCFTLRIENSSSLCGTRSHDAPVFSSRNDMFTLHWHFENSSDFQDKQCASVAQLPSLSVQLLDLALT